VGVEEVAEAVADARRTADEAGIAHAEFRVGRVEDMLPDLAGADVVVDPPRAGLHPRAAAALAAAPAATLVYVACAPASLGRDRAVLEAGGWRLTDVWPVDLFPQTAHLEMVGRFTREAA
jgi:23S rRNA (uracil1939-C5)-methyltransferase